jgi:hypothetical protein
LGEKQIGFGGVLVFCNGGSISLLDLPDGRRAKAAIRLENRQALGQPFLKASFAISRWSGLKRA